MATDVEVTVAGIPAIARVGSIYRDGNGWDEPRTVEINFVLLDRRGRRAEWLDYKLRREATYDNICEQILGAME